jgi:hypothetical protein
MIVRKTAVDDLIEGGPVLRQFFRIVTENHAFGRPSGFSDDSRFPDKAIPFSLLECGRRICFIHLKGAVGQ